MRIKINLSSENPIYLSTSYNRAVQGLIYNLLDYEYREFLHDKGYVFNNRRFKLFTFSKILGRFIIQGSYIVFDKHISLIISSPIDDLIEGICNNIIKLESIELEINRLHLESIEFLHEPNIGEEIIVYTLSPIVVYSTLFTKDGKKKTYYYSPLEEEFSHLITNNLKKKYALLNSSMLEGKVEVEPIKRCREIITSFKGTMIKGWHGKFKISGNRDLILTGYRCGFGSKNSAGFGMVEVYKDVRIYTKVR
jgi:CRISPR-associated endoribonuclease Cas6